MGRGGGDGEVNRHHIVNVDTIRIVGLCRELVGSEGRMGSCMYRHERESGNERGVMGEEGQRETDRQTDRQTETDRQTNRQTDRHERERGRERDTHTHTETETERQKERDKERDRDRQTETDRQTESIILLWYPTRSWVCVGRC